MLRTPKGRKDFLVDPLAQRVPQFLGASVLVGAQPLVLACWDFRRWKQGRKNRQESVNCRLTGV